MSTQNIATANAVRNQRRRQKMAAEDWSPEYESWRHGGWYVTNICYLSGAVGCVSRNFPDRKWRIVDETSVSDLSTVRTFKNRDEAARAERDRALSEVTS